MGYACIQHKITKQTGLLKQIEYPVLNAAAFPGAYTMLPLSAVELIMIKITTCIYTFELLKRIRMLRARQDTRAYMGH